VKGITAKVIRVELTVMKEDVIWRSIMCRSDSKILSDSAHDELEGKRKKQIKGECNMGQQRRIKQFQRGLKQLRRKNEKAGATYFPDEYEVFVPIPENHNEKVDQINEEFEEKSAILKRLMPILPYFSGIFFKLWAIKMEGLLGSVDLWQFVQETSINSHDKSRSALALFLIISTLDKTILSSILYEFGEVYNAKIFWDILEMKYSMKWSEKAEVDEDIVVENDDCVESFVTELETENGSIETAMIDEESVSVVANEATCDNEEIPYNALFSDLVNQLR
jgi:hypothetical protein